MRIRFCLAATLLVPLASAQEKITYDDHVKPIFRAKCFNCHNTSKKTADLDLTSYTAMMAGGGSGEKLVEPGSPGESYLFKLVNHDEEPYMPPEQPKIDAPMIATLQKWIEGGALENSASKAMKKKKGPDLALAAPANGRPAGAAPMPDVLALTPVVVPKTGTAVEAIATSPWAPLIAVSSQKQVVLYHSKDLQPLGILPFPEGVPEVLRFSRNGKLLLAGGGRGAFQGKVVVWDISTGQRVIEVGDEVDSVLAADISSDLTMIALGGPSKMVRVYNTSDGSLAYEIKKHTDWVYDVEFSPDSVLLATSDRNGGLHVWEAENGRPYLTLAGHRGGVPSLSWRADSNLLASGSLDNTVKLWEMENGRQVKSWTAHGGGVSSVEFCRDGRVVTCGRDRTTKIFDGNGKALRGFEAFTDLALKVSFCDETNRVIAGDWTGNIRVWTAADGKRVGELAQNPPPLQQRLAAAQADVVVKQKDAAAKAAAALAAVKRRDGVKAALAANQKLLAEATKLNAVAKQQVPVLTKTLATVKAQLVAATANAKALATAVPQLKTAADSAKQAAVAVPADKELAALVAGVQKKLTQKQAEHKAADALVAAKTAEQTSAAARLTAMQKQLADSAAGVSKANAEIAKYTPQIKPTADVAAKAAAASTAAAAAHVLAQKTVARWTNYIALENELKILTQKQSALTEKQALAGEAAAKLKAAQEAVNAANAALTNVTNQHKATVTKIETMKKSVAALKAESQRAATHAAALESNLPKLKELRTKSAEMVKLVAGDKEIAAAAEQVRVLVEQKTAAIGTLKKSAADKTTAAQKTTTDMAPVIAQAAALQKNMVAAKAKADKMVQDMQPVAKTSAEATTAAAVAKNAVDAAQKIVENRKQVIRPLLNIAG